MSPWARVIRSGDENGSALPLALIVLLILSSLLLPLLTMSAYEPAVSRNHADYASALAAAEAGIAHAIDVLPTIAPINPLPQKVFSGQAFGAGNYTVTVANNTVPGMGLIADTGGPATDTDGFLVLNSTGTVQGAQRQIEVWVRRGSASPFQWAIFADVGVTMSSTSGTDSYDSDVGPYDPATADSEGHVASNGDITLSGSALIEGDASAGGTISDPSHVTGTSTNNAPLVPIPNVDCPTTGFTPFVPCGPGCTYNPATGKLTVSGGNNITLPYPAGGSYYFSEITLSGGSTLTLDTGGQHMDIYVSNKLSTSGGGIVNTGAKPPELTILGCGTSTTAWDLSGGSGAYYAIYAPNHKVTISGDGDVWGAIIADLNVESGGSMVHYDKALARRVWSTDKRYKAAAGTWRER